MSFASNTVDDEESLFNSPQRAHTPGFHNQGRPVLDGLSDPSLSKRTKDVPVGHNQYITMVRLALGFAYDVPVPVLSDMPYETVQALCDVFRAPMEERERKKERAVSADIDLARNSSSIFASRQLLTYSPPGHPSRQMSQSRLKPCFWRRSRMSALVMPS